ncbi:MAG: CBS domain-containing protein [Nitrososphaerales archaeon]|jgi:CBS domain-containing protein
MADLLMTAPVEKLMSERVVTIDIASSVFDAAREIMDRDIGCVVVLKERKVVGIITKGDILREAVMKRLDPSALNVERIMSQPVLTVGMTDTLTEASNLMSEENLTKLPVVNKKGELVGIITSTDIIRRNQLKKMAKDQI